jgi:uncharacterized membrane protein YfcA
VGVTFPVSGVETSLLVPPLVALAISFFTSMAGISGAFLLLPFQMNVLGFTSPAVSATNHVYNVVAIPSGVARYVKERRMLWPLAGVVVGGSLPGVLLGTVVRVRLLPDPRAFRLFAGLVLLFVAARMLAGATRPGRRRPGRDARGAAPGRGRPPAGAVTVREVGLRRVSYVYDGGEYSFPVAGVLGLSVLVGAVGGIYGIGGGAIIAPLLVGLFGLPVHTVAGAALAGTAATSIAAVVSYQVMALANPTLAVGPDWALGILFGVGGMVGMSLGARCQRLVPARAIEGGLGLVLLAVAAPWVVGFFR